MSKVITQMFQLGNQWPTFDPFLFCAYHLDHYPPANGQFGPKDDLTGRNIGQDFQNIGGWNMYHGTQVPGFPSHPHRGFETVTIVATGIVDHSDSNGAAGRYGNGDVQWMTAGEGLQHAEMFPLFNEDKENPLELFQIWINLPASNKLVKPGFKMLWREDIPCVHVEDENNKKIEITIFAGALDDRQPPKPPSHSWAANDDNNVQLWRITIPQGAQFNLPASEANLSRALYFYKGHSARVDDQTVSVNTGMLLASDASIVIKAIEQNCELFLMQGKPINEPVARYGPFVMNTEDQLQQAFHDFQRNQFGGWPWPSLEPVHSDADTRYAKYADGTTEFKRSL